MSFTALILFGVLKLSAATPPMPEPLSITTADGVALRLVSQGTGKPIVFIPGWTMTAEIWEAQMQAFAPFYRCVSFDPRGQGQSAKPAHGYDSRRRAADVHEILEQLDLRDAVLVGWSLGAIDVVNYLQRYGNDRIRGVVLVDNSVDRNFALGHPGARLLKSLRDESVDTGALVQNQVIAMFKSAIPEQRLQEIKALCAQTPDFVARESLAKATTGDGLAAALGKACVPALYAVTPRFAEEGHKLKEAMGPGLTLEIFELAGHALFVDEPERFNRLLADFMAGLP